MDFISSFEQALAECILRMGARAGPLFVMASPKERRRRSRQFGKAGGLGELIVPQAQAAA